MSDERAELRARLRAGAKLGFYIHLTVYVLVNNRRHWALAIAAVLLPAQSTSASDDHPLDPAIAIAQRTLEKMEGIRDYSATFIKRERINGELRSYEYAFIKVRHAPFSVYMKFLKPKSIRGREAIYVEGQNAGRLLVHEPAWDRFGTMALKPDGIIAMRGQHFPITDAGFKNLATKLIEQGEVERAKGTTCRVIFRENAKVEHRTATVVEIVQTERDEDDMFYRVRVYIDDELQIPIRYEAHNWPDKEGGKPLLMEEYTYLNVKLNQGFADVDFDIKNPNYKFPELAASQNSDESSDLPVSR